MTNNREIELELFGRIQEGDEGAFTSIFKTYYEPLYRFSGRFVRDPEIAEGIVQEVFVKIWIERSKINISYDLKTYLYAAVKNHCLNFIKKNRRISSIDETPENQTADVKSPEEEYENDEKMKAIQEAIEKLPNRCKRIFLMKKYDELSYKEIAEILNISVNTVKTQMKRAVKSLLKQLKHLQIIMIFLFLE